MKTALLLIPQISGPIDRQEYLTACIDKAMKEDYFVLAPGVYETYIEIDMANYIEKLLPISDVIYFFVDFGIDKAMFEVIDRLLGKIEFKYSRLNKIQAEKVWVTPYQVLKKVSEKTGISIEDLQSKKRKREIVDARQVYCRRCCEYTRASLSKIGSLINRDHATVMHGRSKAYEVKEVIELYDSIYGSSEIKASPVATDGKNSVFDSEPISRPVLPYRSMDPREQDVQGWTPSLCGMREAGTRRAFSGYRPHCA